ncbi:hypothetical protein [uncultured Nostoc sp.]|uniref:hypothetical protein n=1 Tax=uncultured Nostoc sp. TaxID=340711 RepID=UPI0035CC5AB5
MSNTLQVKVKDISVIESDGSSFWIKPKDENYFQILNYIGVHLKPISINLNELASYTIEVIDKLDADILFIIDENKEECKKKCKF